MTEPSDRVGGAGPVEPSSDPIGPPDDELVERVVDSRVLHRGRYVEFRVDTIERADGSRSERDIAGHPGAVAIVAIDQADRVVLVRQWRIATGGPLWEIPAGGLDADRTTGAPEDPEHAARRELEEETGFRATTWRRLTSFWSAPGFTSELMHVFLATGIAPAGPDDRRGPEEDEHLRIEWRPFDQVVADVERGEIRDAKSVAGILWVARERAGSSASGGAAGAGTELRSGAAEAAVRVAPAAWAAPTVERIWSPTLRDLVLGSGAVMRRSRGMQIFGIVMLTAGALSAWTQELVVGLYPLVLGAAAITGLFAWPFAAWAFVRNRSRFSQPVRVSFGPSGVGYESPSVQSQTPWLGISRIAESGGQLLMELGPQVVFVPQRVLTEADRHEIRRLAAAAGFGPDGRRPATTPAS